MFRAASFFLYVLVIACGKSGQVTTPERKDLVEAVYASGNIVPYDQYKVFALADGSLLERLVNEGDTVAEGQLMFSLESNQQDLKTSYTQEMYRQAQENASQRSPVLQELQSQLGSAKLKRENDSVNYTRFKNLYESESTSKAEYDKAKLAYNLSSSEYSTLKERIVKTREQLSLDLRSAQSQYLINSIDKDHYQVKSIMNGTVYEIYKEKGELVKRGEPIALVGDSKRMYINLLVDEQDIDQVKPGQEVEVKLDAYKDRLFKARVSKVYPMEKKAEQSFRVDADFVETAGLKAGLSAEANIIIQRKSHVLVIPKSFVYAGDSVVTSDGRQVRIVTGIENFDYVEVLSGIDEHTELTRKK